VDRVTRLSLALKNLNETGHALDENSFPTEKEDRRITGFLDILVNDDRFLESLFIALNDETDKQKIKHITNGLVLLYASVNKVDDLMQASVKADNSFNISDEDFIKKSSSKFVFQAFCQNFLYTWLEPQWSNTLLQLINENTDITTDNSRLNTISKLLLHSSFSTIHNCPKSIWKFLSLLTNSTAVDTFTFFMIVLLSKAVKHPERYNLFEERELKLNSKKVLDALSQIFVNFGKKSEFWYGQNPMDKSELENYDNILSRWCLTEINDQEGDFNVNWPLLRQELYHIYHWIISNERKINSVLNPLPPFDIDVECCIEDLFASLQAVEEPEASEPTPDTSSTPNLPSLGATKKKSSTLSLKINSGIFKKKKDKIKN